ncbi:hypothetical protein CVT24_000605 [Panaeolus cyanescens]|uniref:F-box domain-containing protein n=1 Tax=Panaeolus cyanescens TaxID=181874 RepID=A0A409YDH7_9AGAR|nr:hypothetical protein CVT24_000605 [Panaeolus cyanescens]
MSETRTIPDDIIQYIIDILADENLPDLPPRAVPSIPLLEDFSDEVESADPFHYRRNPNIPPGRLYVKKFYTLSHFCLNQARKHMFAHVTLISSGANRDGLTVIRSVPDVNTPSKQFPTIHDQVSFFLEHPGPRSHIRNLTIAMVQSEIDDPVLQMKIPAMLARLENLKNLSIHPSGHWSGLWTQIRPIFRDVLRSHTLECLSLVTLRDFHLKDLLHFTGVKGLELEYTSLLVGDDDTSTVFESAVVNHLLENLSLEGYHSSKSLEALLATNGDARLRAMFSGLKSLEFLVSKIDKLTSTVDIINALTGDSLEKLELYMEEGGESCHCI